MVIDDTIAAISTAVGTGGIGIVRISGDKAIDIVDSIFLSKKNKTLKNSGSHRILYGHIIDDQKQIIDEVLIMVMKAPNTFTREDIIEINCHGGMIVTKKILDLVIRQGVRLAEPGEFTQRAFLNGRIDLSQAEAVIDIINAKTDLALQTSVQQLEGNLSDRVQQLRKSIVEMLAYIEASIDYPEYDLDEPPYDDLYEECEKIKSEISSLLENVDSGRILKEGLDTVIIGKPNVGKSSLLNTLIKENRAIVTDIPGTTRDVLEQYINVKGIPLRIVDTAGIRETENMVEKIGVEKTKEWIEKADLIILLLDATTILTEEDELIFKLVKNKKVIVLLNKIDLPLQITEETLLRRIPYKIIPISAKYGEGIQELETEIKELFFHGKIQVNDQIYINNVRHKNSLLESLHGMENVINTIEMRLPEDCMSIDLKQTYESLGKIIGEEVSDDVIHQIFSQFCLGK